MNYYFDKKIYIFPSLLALTFETSQTAHHDNAIPIRGYPQSTPAESSQFLFTRLAVGHFPMNGTLHLVKIMHQYPAALRFYYELMIGSETLHKSQQSQLGG